jgi:hypothetical protein
VAKIRSPVCTGPGPVFVWQRCCDEFNFHIKRISLPVLLAVLQHGLYNAITYGLDLKME